jgi:hypothetical protein
MAAGNSYRVLGVPGEVVVLGLGSAAAPSVVFGNPDLLGGMNDGFYATSTPTVGISINGSSVVTWSASGMATGNISTSGTVATGALTVTGAISATTTIASTGPTSGIGYATGAGGAVTQGTSKSQGVTLNTVCGAITMHNAALAASALVTFIVTNSAVNLDDGIIVNHSSAGTLGPYFVAANTITAGAFSISVYNLNGTSLTEAIVLTFAVVKGVAA